MTHVPEFFLFWLKQKHIKGREADIHIQVSNKNNNNFLLKQNRALCKKFPMDQLASILKAGNLSSWWKRSVIILSELSEQDYQCSPNNKIENLFIFLFNHLNLQTVNICKHFILFKKYHSLSALTHLSFSLTNDMGILRLV